MEYQNLEESGRLRIDYQGNKMDTYTLAILNLNLQDIIDKVAYSSLHREGLLGPRHKRFRPRSALPTYSDVRLIRAEVTEIRSGSLFEEISFFIPAILADANVRAVLQGVVANIIFAIGTSGIRGISNTNNNEYDQSEYRRRLPRDPEIGGNLRDITMALAENGGGEIEFSHQTPNGTKTKVKIKVNNT